MPISDSAVSNLAMFKLPSPDDNMPLWLAFIVGAGFGGMVWVRYDIFVVDLAGTALCALAGGWWAARLAKVLRVE